MAGVAAAVASGHASRPRAALHALLRLADPRRRRPRRRRAAPRAARVLDAHEGHHRRRRRRLHGPQPADAAPRDPPRRGAQGAPAVPRGRGARPRVPRPRPRPRARARPAVPLHPDAASRPTPRPRPNEPAPRPFTMEEKEALREEVRLADEFAKQLGRRICVRARAAPRAHRVSPSSPTSSRRSRSCSPTSTASSTPRGGRADGRAASRAVENMRPAASAVI